jgi:hypothetical protein
VYLHVICVSVYLPVPSYMSLSLYLKSVNICITVSPCLPVSLSVRACVCLYTCLTVHFPVCLYFRIALAVAQWLRHYASCLKASGCE